MKYFVFIILVSITTSVFAQTVELSDTNFAKAVCRDYPAIMDAQCLNIDTSKADKIDDILDLSNENIVDASAVTYFNRIDTLILKGNNLKTFLSNIPTSNFWSISYLDLSDNQLTKFPLLNINVNYSLIRNIYFQNNQATELQKFWGVRDSLFNLDVSGNKLKDCEDYSMALQAQSIKLNNNFFTFEDILPQTKHPRFEEVFVVSPQRTIQWEVSSFEGKELQTFTLKIPIDEKIKNNVYAWYKDGEFFKNTNTNTLVFDTLQLKDAGYYSIKITNQNALLNNVELQTEMIELQVTPCMYLKDRSIMFVTDLCHAGAVQFTDAPSDEGRAPFSYTFSNETDTFSFANKDTIKMKEGEYTVSVVDADGCSKIFNSPLQIQGLSECDYHVISPDGDGLQDEYYFDLQGEAKIYNFQGALIKTIAMPGFWDAKTDDGTTVAPGKYIMILNQKDKYQLKIVW